VIRGRERTESLLHRMGLFYLCASGVFFRCPYPKGAGQPNDEPAEEPRGRKAKPAFDRHHRAKDGLVIGEEVPYPRQALARRA